MPDIHPTHITPPMPQVSVEPHQDLVMDAPRCDIYVDQKQPKINMQEFEPIHITPPVQRVEVQPHEPIVMRTHELQVHVRAGKPNIHMDHVSPIYVRAPKPEIVCQPTSPMYVQPPTPTVIVREPKPHHVTMREESPCIIKERTSVVEPVMHRTSHVVKPINAGVVKYHHHDVSTEEEVVVRERVVHGAHHHNYHHGGVRYVNDTYTDSDRHGRVIRYEGGEESSSIPAKEAKPVFMGMALFNASNF